MLEQIKSLEELRRIFPEHIKMISANDDNFVKYYFALILLEQKKSFYHDLAFDILFEEFSKKEVNAVVRNNNLYNSIDLSKQIAKSDIYKIRSVLTERKTYIHFFGLNILEWTKTNTHKSIKFLGITVFKKRVKVY